MPLVKMKLADLFEEGLYRRLYRYANATWPCSFYSCTLEKDLSARSLQKDERDLCLLPDAHTCIQTRTELKNGWVHSMLSRMLG
jgi:hypothetical protein